MSRLLTTLTVACLAAACGPSTGSSTFVGTVGGAALSVKESFFSPLRSSNGTVNGLGVVLGDQTGLCTQLKSNRTIKNMTYTIIFLANVNANLVTTAPSGPGEFVVMTGQGGLPAGNDAQSFFAKLDGTCKNTLTAEQTVGQSGLVKVTSLTASTGGSVRGSFDITYGTQKDKTSGTLDAPFCELPIMTSMPSCE